MRSRVAAPTWSPGSAGRITLVPAELAIQRGWIDPEDLRRARLVAAFALQHPRDVRLLDDVEGGIDVGPLREQRLGFVLGDLGGHRGEGDRLPLAQDPRPLERVPPLPHAAGPAVT